MRKISIVWLIVLLSSCSGNKLPIKKGIYYWKSKPYSLTEKESHFFDTLSLDKVYIKFFEINYDNVVGAIPYAKSKITFYFLSKEQDFVPCVYIRNNVFLKSSREELDQLVKNMSHLISKRVNEGHFNNRSSVFNEIQIDCDWTKNSKENYFYFISKFKLETRKTISCTLRLYPYKFEERMGVPPCDRVMLMCYNLLNPIGNDEVNSILSVKELSKYILPKKKYPLPIDIALPNYSWNLCYDNAHYKGKIDGEITDLSNISTQINPLWRRITKDTLIDNIYLRMGDRLKTETISFNELKRVASILKENTHLENDASIVFYHLSEKNINTNEEFNSIFSIFSN